MVSKGILRQYLTAFCASLSNFCGSAAFVWITPLLVRLLQPDSEIPITADQGSWIVSILEVGDLFVPLPAGILVDKIGRKPLLLLAGPLFIVGWILVLTTRSVEIIYLVRIIQGMGIGLTYTVLPLYLAEIAGVEVRATLGYFFQGIWYAGNIYVYCIGPFVTYQALNWISLAPPIVFMLCFVWFPESPHFLMMRGREKEAAESLAWLRGYDDISSVEEELSTIRESVQEEIKNKATWKDLFSTPTGRKSFTIVNLIATSYIMSGGTALFSYATDTFTKLGAEGYSADFYTIVMGVSVLLCVPFSGVAVDRMGRRPILLLSSIGSSVCLAITTVYLYLKSNTDINVSNFTWVPFLFIISYTILIGSGVEAIVPVLQAELFPNSTRGVACAITFFFMTITSMICLKMYQVIADNIGLYFLYFIFTCFSIMGSLYMYFFVPETRGKTFSEIQILLGSKSK